MRALPTVAGQAEITRSGESAGTTSFSVTFVVVRFSFRGIDVRQLHCYAIMGSGKVCSELVEILLVMVGFSFRAYTRMITEFLPTAQLL